MLYLLYKIGLPLLRISTTRAAYAVVSFFARLKYAISKKDRETVKANLRRAVPEAGTREISLLARGVFENFGRYIVDFFSLTKDNKEDYLKKSVRLVGIENIDEALKHGKGCILIAGHFGNWELGGCAISVLGYKVNAIALAHADPRVNNIFTAQREMAGINVIHSGTAAAACQNALRNGEIVGLLADRPFGDRGIEVKFFGKTAIFPRGAALLSLKQGAPIVMMLTYKEDPNTGKYVLIFDKPYLVKREGPLEDQLMAITQRFADKFECLIRKYPSQWYMFNKVWEE